MHKLLERQASRFLALWEIDSIKPPEAALKLSPRQKAKHKSRVANAREKADFLFSLLPLAPLKEGYHPAPGSCLWIYATIVDQYLQPPEPPPNYQAFYQGLNNHQRELEIKDLISRLKAISDSQIELLAQTGPAPYWVAKSLFPLPTPLNTKETYSPVQIWKLDFLSH